MMLRLLLFPSLLCDEWQDESLTRNVLRIGIQSLGSPVWPMTDGYSLPRFLLALRGLVRSALAVCVITMPTHLIEVRTLDAGFGIYVV
jgi:hypothetical protein